MGAMTYSQPALDYSQVVATVLFTSEASMAPKTTTLLDAERIAGGIEALARKIRVPTKQLRSWIEGELDAPPTVLMRAFDLVQGAHAPGK
jgi:hypothetical protein